MGVVRKYSSMFGVFCIVDWYFEYDIRILYLFLYIWSWKMWFFDIFRLKTVPEVWTIFVRDISGDIFGILVLNGPLIKLYRQFPIYKLFRLTFSNEFGLQIWFFVWKYERFEERLLFASKIWSSVWKLERFEEGYVFASKIWCFVQKYEHFEESYLFASKVSFFVWKYERFEERYLFAS